MGSSRKIHSIHLCFFAQCILATVVSGVVFHTGIKTSLSTVVGSGNVTQSGTIETKQYTVPSRFVQILNEARSDTGDGVPTIIQNANGTYSLKLQLTSGTKTYDNLDKNLLSLFVELYKNPQLQVKVVSEQGSNEVISVSADTSLSSGSIQVTQKELTLLQKLQTNVNLKVTSITSEDGKTYTVKVSDGTKTETLTGISASLAKVIKLVAKDPNLHLRISGTADKPTIQIIYGSGSQQTFTVNANFLQILKDFQKDPKAKINVVREGDAFNVEITSGGQTKTYKKVKPELVALFKLLVSHPEVNFKVTPAANGQLTIVLPDSVHVTSPTIIQSPEIVNELPKLLQNPNIKIRIQQTSDGQYELIIDDGSGEKKYKIPASQVKVIYNLLKKKPTKPIVSGKTSDGGVVVTDKPTSTGSTTHQIEPDFQILLQKLKDDPKLKPQYKIHQEPNGEIDITITIGSTTKTYKNIPKQIVTFFVKLVDNRGTPHTEEKEPGKKPTETIPVEPTKPVEVPNDQVQLLNTVKTSPKLSISVKPTKPGHYDITVTDDKGPKTYHDVTIKVLITIIETRNNKDLPFEILPADKPGHQKVKVPKPNSPDVLTFEVEPSVLDVTDALKHDPNSELSITPDKKGTYTVTFKSGKLKKNLANLPSTAVDTIVRLRTDDNLPFYLEPGKHGKISLIVPKEEQEPVHAQLTPTLVSLIKDIRKDHAHTTLDIKPEKSGKFTLVVNRKSKKTDYPHITAELVPILSHLFTVPNADFDIKPGKDNTIEFVPATLTPDTERFKVDYDVLDIIAILRKNPSATVNIQPDKKGKFTITVTDDDGKKKYDHISPDSLRLISDLQTNPKATFSIKPTKDGHVIIIIPKTSHKQATVTVTPDTKNIVETIRKNPSADLTIHPGKSGTYTIELGGKKYPGVSPSLLLLIITLVSKPSLNFQVEPGTDGNLKIVIPKENPKTTEVTIPLEVVNILNHLKKNPKADVTVTRNKKGSVDLDIEINGKNYKLVNLKPDAADLLITLVTNPTLPFHIYSEDGKYKLVTRKRPGDLVFHDIPNDIIDLVQKEQKRPGLKIKIENLGSRHFNVQLYDGTKLLKTVKDATGEIVQLLCLVVTNPNIEISVITDSKGKKELKTSSVDTTTFNFPLPASALKPIQLAKSPNVKAVGVKHGKNRRFDITLDIAGKATTFDGLDANVINIILLLQTHRHLEIDIYIGVGGTFTISLPKSALPTSFNGITKSFYDYITKVQPKADVTTFTLKPLAGRTKFDLNVVSPAGNKNWKNLPTVEVELFITIVLHPSLKPEVSTGSSGLLNIGLGKHIPHVTFKNVSPKFLKLASEVRLNVNSSVSIKRNGDLSVYVIVGQKALEFKKVDSILLELFISLFADPNFHYTSHLQSDGSVTLIAEKYNRFQVFYDIKKDFFNLVKQLTTAAHPTLFLSHGKNGGYDASLTFDGKKAIPFRDINIENLRLLIVTISNKGLKLKGKVTRTGTVDIEINLPERKAVYDFNLFSIVVDFVKDVGKLFGGVFGTLAQAAGYVVGGFGNAVVNVVEGAGNILTGIGKGVGSVIKGIFG